MTKRTFVSHASLLLQSQGMHDRIGAALSRIAQSGGVDGAHHKQWVLDQVVRILTECPEVEHEALDVNGLKYTYTALGESPDYLRWLADYRAGDDGPNTYEWDEGIPP